MLDHHEVQKALSARIDGEPSGYDDAVIDAHVANCEECSEYWKKATSLSRTLSFVDAGDGMAPPSDLAQSIVAGVEPEWRRLARRRIVALSIGRIALVLVGVLHIVWALQLVVDSGALGVSAPVADGLGQDPALGALMMQTAALRFGLALAFFFAAWRPPTIPGVLLITGSMFTFTLGFAVRDWVLLGTMENWGEMGTLAVSCIALAWTWVADRGVEIQRAWRMLDANPS